MDPSDIRTTLVTTGAGLPEDIQQRILDLGPAATAPLLEVFLDDGLRSGEEAPHAPTHAAELLALLTPPEALPALIAEYLEGDPLTLVGDAAARALPKYGRAALEPLLQAYADTGDPEQRTRLCIILSELGVRDERIYACLVESFPHDIDMGAGSLAAYGDDRALPLLHETLDAWTKSPHACAPPPATSRAAPISATATSTP